jgi:hypothetical protein
MKQLFAVSTLPFMCLAPTAPWHWYAPLLNYQFWLVVAAFLTLFVIGWQAVETRRAAEETKLAAEATQRSTAAIERQAGIMEQQMKAMETAAEAAKASAEAANANIKLFINKERAWLAVEVDDLVWENPIVPPPVTTLKGVYYKVRFFGSTPAFIEDSSVSAFLYDPAQNTGINDIPMAIPVPKIVSADTKLETFHTSILPRILTSLDLSNDELDAIKKGKLAVRFRGFVRYRDAFEIERETKFDYLWKESGLFGFGTEWTKYGTPADNVES